MSSFYTRTQESVKPASELHSDELLLIGWWILRNQHHLPSAGPEDVIDELNYTTEYRKRLGKAVMALAAEQGVMLTHTEWNEYIYV